MIVNKDLMRVKDMPEAAHKLNSMRKSMEAGHIVVMCGIFGFLIIFWALIIMFLTNWGG